MYFVLSKDVLFYVIGLTSQDYCLCDRIDVTFLIFYALQVYIKLPPFVLCSFILMQLILFFCGPAFYQDQEKDENWRNWSQEVWNYKNPHKTSKRLSRCQKPTSCSCQASYVPNLYKQAHIKLILGWISRIKKWASFLL
jgi:hypothetical protein